MLPYEKDFICFIHESTFIFEEEQENEKLSKLKDFIKNLKSIADKLKLQHVQKTIADVASKPKDILNEILTSLKLKGTKVGEWIENTYNSVNERLNGKFPHAIVGLIALGVTLAIAIKIIKSKSQEELNESFFEDSMLLDAYIEESTISPKALFDTLYDGFKCAEDIARNTKNEIKKKIANIIATTILASLVIITSTYLASPILRLCFKIDEKLGTPDIKTKFCKSDSCLVGKTTATFVFISAIIWDIAGLNKVFGKKSFCDFAKEKVCTTQ